MTELSHVLTEPGWDRTESLVLATVLVGMLATWALFVTVPPDGFVEPYGIVISFVAGAYLAFVLYSYLRY